MTNQLSATFSDSEVEPYIPYLRIWTSGKAGEGESILRRYDEFIETPHIYAGGDIKEIRPIYILPSEVAYRPVKEKCNIHAAYPRFWAYVQSGENAQQKWWDNFYDDKKILSTYTDPARVWASKL